MSSKTNSGLRSPDSGLPQDIHFIERGWFHCNHVVIEDPGGPVLIDSGQHVGVEETIRLLRERGIEPKELQLILTTHSHTDHWGANAYLHELSGAPVVCSPLTAEILRNYDTRAMWIDYFGVDDFDLPPPSPVTRTISPGDSISLGQYRFDVLAAPGHAPESIALFEPTLKLLLCTDTMFEGESGVMNIEASGPDTLEQALATLDSFKPLHATVALPGHGPMITDVAGNIEIVSKIIRTFQQRPDKLARHLAARSLVYSLLILQPINRLKLVSMFEHAPWVYDVGKTLQIESHADFLHKLIEVFIQRGIVQDNDGILTTNVPR